MLEIICLSFDNIGLATSLSFDPLLFNNLCEYPHRPYTDRTRSPWAALLNSMSLSLFNFAPWAVKGRKYCAVYRIIGRLSSSNVVIFGTKRKCPCCFSSPVITSNHGPTFHQFGDTAI